MEHIEHISTKQLENWLIEKIWALEDLLQVKSSKTFNEYVTVENIDKWITQQQIEIDAMKRIIQKRKAAQND